MEAHWYIDTFLNLSPRPLTHGLIKTVPLITFNLNLHSKEYLFFLKLIKHAFYFYYREDPLEFCRGPSQTESKKMSNIYMPRLK